MSLTYTETEPPQREGTLKWTHKSHWHKFGVCQALEVAASGPSETPMEPSDTAPLETSSLAGLPVVADASVEEPPEALVPELTEAEKTWIE